MKESNGNIKLKIFRGIFASVNLVLICGGLVSCIPQLPKPLVPTEQQKPVLQPNQPNSNDKYDNDNDDDGKDDEEDNDKDGDDKD
ncbi:MAG: hypothetical protein RMX97_09300 [Nostoc sp. DedQUE11]|uniref:hypothetical protein n=1 Tax=Nostoc sp. CCY 9925 TaxID=3103865 RepID=UPI002AD8EA88|nr:hypothetical protein [Nostoc sp. DedQUE11]